MSVSLSQFSNKSLKGKTLFLTVLSKTYSLCIVSKTSLDQSFVLNVGLKALFQINNDTVVHDSFSGAALEFWESCY
jgi:hypothetical protein